MQTACCQLSLCLTQRAANKIGDNYLTLLQSVGGEINELFDELISNVKNVNAKKEDSKKVLNHFANKHREFFSLRDKNLDPHNTIFLITYELLSITYLWSNNLAQIGKEIEIQKTLNDDLVARVIAGAKEFKRQVFHM